MNAPSPDCEATFTRLRHDVRNTLSTALLAADMLANHDDAAVRKHARTIIAAIETATDRLRTKNPKPD